MAVKTLAQLNSGRDFGDVLRDVLWCTILWVSVQSAKGWGWSVRGTSASYTFRVRLSVYVCVCVCVCVCVIGGGSMQVTWDME